MNKSAALLSGIGLTMGLLWLVLHKKSAGAEGFCASDSMIWDPVLKKCVQDPRWVEGSCPEGTVWQVWPCFTPPCPGECVPIGGTV